MPDDHKQATASVTRYVEGAEKAIKAFRKEGINRHGVLIDPREQLASLKIARDQLGMAIAIIERTEWA